ncbi:FCD domain-containing protein [Rhizobium sp. AN63]|uniref:GntR family transcriptional regulator n=1 Tax=Rhizobium sp. AN63 TaxID=3035210 RepID=UPI0027D405E1|nr:FCD domain-containing protein [Rhizobium sp. AN63]MDQ4408821.1 FCD domain-containing protein [Rhizobium sp. AN63]
MHKVDSPETRAVVVLQRMRKDIIDCVLMPGSKLRFEAMKESYSVSFSTIREALSRLAAEGLVVSVGQRGFVVAPVSLRDLNDLTDVRVLIEKEALRLSMLKGNDAWEANILGTYHRMDRLQTRLGAEYYLSEDWAVLHSAFHSSLVSACDSPNLVEIRHQLFERAHRYRRMSSQFRPKWREKTAEHTEIMSAVLERQEMKALQLIDLHIRETTRNVIMHAGHLFTEHQDEIDKALRHDVAAEVESLGR